MVLDVAGQQPDLLDQTSQRTSQASAELAVGIHFQFGADAGRRIQPRFKG